jgi:hypothetical protein
MTITIPDYISTRVQVEADALGKTSEERVVEILNREIAPENNFDKDYINKGLENIKNLLAKIPCVPFVATSKIGESFWWLKFRINIKSKIAWTVVQELGYILNYLSLNEKLLDSFYPVSPPPYLDGGPEEFLS